MQITAVLVSSVLAMASMVTAAPAALTAKQQAPGACFVVGNVALPQEVADVANSVKANVTCDASVKVLGNQIPDTESDGIKFSDIDFSKSKLSTLAFSLEEFATPADPADACLEEFENSLNVYLATEAGVRSVGGSLAIKVPKFFLAFQVARIKTAQGIKVANAGQTVEHLLGKVVKNSKGQDVKLIAQVQALAKVL